MADKKISALTDGTPAQGTDEIVVARAGTNVKLPLSGVVAPAAADTQVLLKDSASVGGIKGSADFVFNDTLKALVLGGDVYLYREAAGVLAQRNDVNQQTLRFYNTYTDNSNYERGSLGWSANIFRFVIEQAGSGISRIVRFGTTGASSIYFMLENADRWIMDRFGQFYPTTDGAAPIGGSTTRIRNLFLGGHPSLVPVHVKLHATQTGNALEVQSSSGTPLSFINKDGVVTTPKVTLTGGPLWTSGSGTPEAVVAAPVGSLYSQTDGGAGTTLYVKESGTGNTGWVAK